MIENVSLHLGSTDHDDSHYYGRLPRVLDGSPTIFAYV
jgi:hypothetical protein